MLGHVNVLVEVDDVAFVDVDEFGYRRQNALFVGAVQQKNGGVFIVVFHTLVANSRKVTDFLSDKRYFLSKITETVARNPYFYKTKTNS